MTTTALNTNVSGVENKIPNHDKYITTSEFNKLTTENVAARLIMMMMSCFVVWLTDEKRLALFPSWTTGRNPHHHEYLTRREQDLNLRRTCVQAVLNEVVQ